MTKLIAKVKFQKTDTLLEMSRTVAADESAEATMVLDAILAELSCRLPEAAFVAHCDGL